MKSAMPSATVAMLLLSLLAVSLLAPPLAGAQQPAGVVTTLVGQATVTRGTAPSPLRFREDVFLRDRIDTREKSIVRVLLGGKALVTVRELSSLIVTEQAGRATIDLDSGKIGVGVAKQLMRPGETLEIRTPNAVATVRGTVLIVDVARPSAPAGGPPSAATTTVSVLSGNVELLLRGAAGGPLVIGPMQSVAATGALLGPVRPIPAGAMAQLLGGLRAGPQHTSTPDAAQQLVDSGSQTTALGLATALAGTTFVRPALPAARPEVIQYSPTTATADAIVATKTVPLTSTVETVGGTTVTPTPGTVTPVPGNLIQNGSFETGNFSGWTLSNGMGGPGAGLVLTENDFDLNVGKVIPPPEGKFFALIHTATGAVLPSCSSGTACTLTQLQQNFTATSAVQVRFRAVLMTNEFPTFTQSASEFKDQFIVQITDAAGQPITVFQTNVNDQNANFLPAQKSATAGAFTLDQGAGVVDLGIITKTVVPAPGQETLQFQITNVSDTALDSAVALDAVVVVADPPLYFLRDGSAVASGPAPLLDVAGGTRTFDSLLVACCGSSVTLGGPLLRAVNADLTVPFSLTSIVQGGSLVSTTTDPLVQLSGGRYTLGAAAGMFDIAGVNVAVDPATGLTLGTDEPLRHGGTFLEASGATVSTQSVLKIDTALLEASRPLLDLRAGASVTTDGPVIDLSMRSKVVSVGPLVRLDASTLSTRYALVNVNGSVLTGSGPLLLLANGSTINAGALASISNGGRFTWAGPLAQFSGTSNAINFNNTLCASLTCVTAGGVRFALAGGATPANVVVTNPNPWAGLGTAGTVTMPANAAQVLVSGPGSRVTLKP